MVTARQLARDEITSLWSIDRSELVDAVYYVERGMLALRREHHDLHGWPPGEPDKYTPGLEACHARGGWFHGLFDGQRLIGAAVLDSRFIGTPRDQLQLVFLHVSRAYRNLGCGRRLFLAAHSEAMQRGARRLYISSIPSEHTVGFYLHLGCSLVPEPDAELFALEPDDIHLECTLT